MYGEFGAVLISSPSIATSVWNCLEGRGVSVLSNADVSRVFFGWP